MASSKVQFLVDETGKKKAVVLSLREYRQLLRRVEDLQDALELDVAVRTAEGFRDYEEVRRDLKDEGRL